MYRNNIVHKKKNNKNIKEYEETNKEKNASFSQQ